MNKNDLMNYYKGKNVYITGITGFKGSWMALMLHHLGANVYGMGLEQEDKDSIFHVANIESFADVTIDDITSPAKHSKLITSIVKSNPDYIFHMAAQPIVSIGYSDPFGTFNTNIMGTVILHEVLRGSTFPVDKNDPFGKQKQLSVINITTDKVYKESTGALKEGDELFGFDPYSLSKSCSDMISTCYREAMGSNHLISTARAGNVIGGGDMAPNRIIPDIVRAAQIGGSVEIRHPESVRPYQHVFDAINAYLVIAVLQKQSNELQGEWNVGPDLDQIMTTEVLANKMQEHMNFTWENTGKSIGHENAYLILNNEKVKSHGWVPAYPNNDTVVKATSEWYNEYINGGDMKEFTLKQIEEAYNNAN